MPLTRRELIEKALGAAAASALGTLPALGAQGGRVPYGSALYLPDLTADVRVGRAIIEHCNRVSPVSELKWNTLRPSDGVFDFASGDAIADFARTNKLAMHGHTLIWYADMPDWVRAYDGHQGGERLMAEHIETVAAHYAGTIASWDVVNEPIPDAAPDETTLRDGFWLNRMGKSYVGTAFRLAHVAAPQALLVLNEYDIEFAVDRSPAKRAAFRRLVLDLLDEGAPIGAIGLQGHLRGGWPIAKDELAAFVAEMRDLGLKVLVTELDVQDQDLPGPEAERDNLIATQVYDFLEAVTDSGPLESLTTWGISDQYSWVRWAYPRTDGTHNRPLPLDWDFEPKPFKVVIDHFLKKTT